MAATSDTPSPTPRRFVPANLDCADFAQLEPLYKSLLDRSLGSTRDVEQFLLDFSELTAAVDEYGSRRYIDKSCHTDDPEIERRFMHFVENVEPQIKPLYFQLQKKMLEAQPTSLLSNDKRYAVLLRKCESRRRSHRGLRTRSRPRVQPRRLVRSALTSVRTPMSRRTLFIETS